MKKSKNKLNLILLSVLLVALMVYAYFLILDKFPQRLPELSTDGFVQVSIETGDKELIIGTECLAVKGSVSEDMIKSIDNALAKTKDERPLTHDMTTNILESYDIKVLMVKITELKDRNFIGRLLLESDSKIINLDVRPSDGIALALRANAPIYMNSTLLEEMGQNVC